MRDLKVMEIRVSTGDTAPLVVLAEVAEPGRLLPIWMSNSGASAIFTATDEADPERPDVHDLVWKILAGSQAELIAAELISYAEGQYFAELVLSDRRIPARASDAIAIALRAGCPIRAAEEVLEQAGVAASAAAPTEDEVERFREFLDTINPEDFTGEGKP